MKFTTKQKVDLILGWYHIHKPETFNPKFTEDMWNIIIGNGSLSDAQEAAIDRIFEGYRIPDTIKFNPYKEES